MAPQSRRTDGEIAGENRDEPEVVRLRTSPGRFVFTERGNADGWIATDSVVDLER